MGWKVFVLCDRSESTVFECFSKQSNLLSDWNKFRTKSHWLLTTRETHRSFGTVIGYLNSSTSRRKTHSVLAFLSVLLRILRVATRSHSFHVEIHEKDYLYILKHALYEQTLRRKITGHPVHTMRHNRLRSEEHPYFMQTGNFSASLLNGRRM